MYKNQYIIYKVEGLNKNEASQLFSWCAFERDVRKTNLLTDISMKVIEYADGNPLALRVYSKETRAAKSKGNFVPQAQTRSSTADYGSSKE